jgi:hypothetical protein
MVEGLVARLRWPGIHGADDHPVSVKLRVEAADLIEQQAASLAAKDKELARYKRLLDLEAEDHDKANNRAEQAEQATFRERDKAEIAELRASVDKLTNSTDNGALCLEINDLTARLADALSEVGGLRRALARIAAIEPVSNCDAGSMARSRMRDIARAFVAQHGSDSREGKS